MDNENLTHDHSHYYKEKIFSWGWLTGLDAWFIYHCGKHGGMQARHSAKERAKSYTFRLAGSWKKETLALV